MSKHTGSQSGGKINPTKPINVIDGIPDRSPNPSWWKYLLIVVVFAAWVAFLVYVQIAGRIGD